MPSNNTPRSDALRAAPLNSWVALSEDETRVIATGASYEEVSNRLDDAGVENSVIIKTPESWLTGLLGRTGFFEHFKIIFDPSTTPPGFELERIYRV